MIYKVTDMEKASLLFGSWEEAAIWSCLDGTMGNIYGNDSKEPSSVMAVMGDFTFLAGSPSQELISYNPRGNANTFSILVPQSREWADGIMEHYGRKARMISRYATKKEPDVFHRPSLQKAVDSLEKGFEKDFQLCLIDEGLYHLCKEEAWSRDLVSLFPSYQDYRRLGLGAVILKNGRPISGTSSYFRYKGGIEIQVDTKEEYRRQGLAYICSAKLILECLDRGLYPSWDAHNKASIALAQKLGYHYSHTYTAVEIWYT